MACAFLSAYLSASPAYKIFRQVYCISAARAKEAQANCEYILGPSIASAHSRYLEVGWVVGWLNILGQVAGLSSTEFGLSSMIWAAIVVAKDGNYQVTSGKVVGLFAGLLIFHGVLVRLEYARLMEICPL